MSRAIRVVRQTALVRATNIWGEAALSARDTLRRQGVVGDLRPISEIASGRRGSAVPRGVVQFAMDLERAGMDSESIGGLLLKSVRQMIDDAHESVIDGPHAA